MSEEYDLKKSEKGIGQLYPVLLSKDGKVIDGFHRLKDDPNWKKVTLPEIDSEEKLLIARAVSNWHRREVLREEKAEWINGLAGIYQKQGYKILKVFPYTNEIKQKIADVTGLKEWTVVDYLHAEFKQTITTPYIPKSELSDSEKVEKVLGKDGAKKFRGQVLEEAKLSPEEKAKLEEEKQRKKEEKEKKKAEAKRKKEQKEKELEEKLQKKAEEKAKQDLLQNEAFIKEAASHVQEFENKPTENEPPVDTSRIVKEMVEVYLPAIQDAFQKVPPETPYEPERNKLVLNMLLKSLQQGLVFCPVCKQTMLECSHCHTSLKTMKEGAKI